MTQAETLLDMSRETRSVYRYYCARGDRTIQLPFRVSSAERDAIKAAATAENKPVSEFIRAAIAVRARDGYCKTAQGQTAS